MFFDPLPIGTFFSERRHSLAKTGQHWICLHSSESPNVAGSQRERERVIHGHISRAHWEDNADSIVTKAAFCRDGRTVPHFRRTHTQHNNNNYRDGCAYRHSVSLVGGWRLCALGTPHKKCHWGLIFDCDASSQGLQPAPTLSLTHTPPFSH